MSKTPFEQAIELSPIIAIVRGRDVDGAIAQAERLWDAGVAAVEVTIETPAAIPSLAAVAAAAHSRGAVVGAGSILTVEQFEIAAHLGVGFTVAPGVDPGVLATARSRGIPHIPGVATATEIMLAGAHGARMVKAFPASSLGPSWVRAQSAPFPELRVIATGGLTPADIDTYLEAGCLAVGISDRNIAPSWRATRAETKGEGA